MEGTPKNEASGLQFPEIAENLKGMASEDQVARHAVTEEGLNQETKQERGRAMVEIDRRNTVAMKQIIADIGWPTVSKVGQEASRNAWLLVQHADQDPQFQEECLALMRQEPESEVWPADMAYLEDRVRVNTNREQVYGTQGREQRDEAGEVTDWQPLPIEDAEHVNERRASVGLNPLEDYVRELKEHLFPHLLEKE